PIELVKRLSSADGRPREYAKAQVVKILGAGAGLLEFVGKVAILAASPVLAIGAVIGGAINAAIDKWTTGKSNFTGNVSDAFKTLFKTPWKALEKPADKVKDYVVIFEKTDPYTIRKKAEEETALEIAQQAETSTKIKVAKSSIEAAIRRIINSEDKSATDFIILIFTKDNTSLNDLTKDNALLNDLTPENKSKIVALLTLKDNVNKRDITAISEALNLIVAATEEPKKTNWFISLKNKIGDALASVREKTRGNLESDLQVVAHKAEIERMEPIKLEAFEVAKNEAKR
ncbi:MAG: hypothetical protein NT128_08295, partial [Proteobacteria bacterium]|nr:hypothetical protein [Pseudomonadota bacterium]